MMPFFSRFWYERQTALLELLASQSGLGWTVTTSSNTFGSGSIAPPSGISDNVNLTDILREVEVCVYSLKCLRRLMVYGKPALSQGSQAATVMGNIHACLSQMLAPVLNGFGLSSNAHDSVNDASDLLPCVVGSVKLSLS